MNAHLDIDDLLTGSAGERVRAHLDDCADCRTEAARWETVGNAVCGLMAGTTEPALPAFPTGRWQSRRSRTALVASAAAAALVLGGAGYGLTAALARSAPAVTIVSLTAVSGCDGLEQADGTLAQVNGSSVVVTTSSGQRVTATTSASTRFSVYGVPLSAITDGASVTVLGPESDGRLQASHILLDGTGGGPMSGDGPPGAGTVADVTSSGFTLDEPGGTRVAVSTSGETGVMLLQAGLSQLRTGGYTIAVGYPQANGTLAAIAVNEPPSSKARVQFQGCTPASVDRAFTAAFMAVG
jgi:hypothetical protein